MMAYYGGMTRMLDKAVHDRPREKLARYGAAKLSDFELLQALIGKGNQQADVTAIARKLQALLQQHGANVTYDQIGAVTGIGPARAAEVMAALELGKRYLLPPESPIIDTPQAAAAQLSDIRDKKQEHFVVLSLDGANRLIAKRIVTIGTLTASLVHPREVFADPLADRAAGIIVAHNHPSGSLVASQADIEVTQRLREAGVLLGVKLLDHIIVTAHDFAVISVAV